MASHALCGLGQNHIMVQKNNSFHQADAEEPESTKLGSTSAVTKHKIIMMPFHCRDTISCLPRYTKVQEGDLINQRSIIKRKKRLPRANKYQT